MPPLKVKKKARVKRTNNLSSVTLSGRRRARQGAQLGIRRLELPTTQLPTDAVGVRELQVSEDLDGEDADALRKLENWHSAK